MTKRTQALIDAHHRARSELIAHLVDAGWNAKTISDVVNVQVAGAPPPGEERKSFFAHMLDDFLDPKR